MASKVGNKPGQEIALTDKSYHTWAYTCLIDGRILVQCAHPKQGWGYFLMTPNPGGEPRFERIDCELATKGILDRVSISPSETKVCFEYQKGFKYKDTGRTLYIADFDAKKPSITNAKAVRQRGGGESLVRLPPLDEGRKSDRLPRQPLALPVHVGGRVHRESVDQGRRRLPLPPLRGDAEVELQAIESMEITLATLRRHVGTSSTPNVRQF